MQSYIYVYEMTWDKENHTKWTLKKCPSGRARGQPTYTKSFFKDDNLLSSLLGDKYVPQIRHLTCQEYTEVMVLKTYWAKELVNCRFLGSNSRMSNLVGLFQRIHTHHKYPKWERCLQSASHNSRLSGPGNQKIWARNLNFLKKKVNELT